MKISQNRRNGDVTGTKMLKNRRINVAESHLRIKMSQERCRTISRIEVLIDCIDLGLVRPRFYAVPDKKALFDTVLKCRSDFIICKGDKFVFKYLRC